MLILYGLASVFLLLSHLFFRVKKMVLGNVFVTIGLFLNPLGYDIVVYGITLLTKSYWMTMSVMYMLAFVFFGLFMYFYNVNPFKRLRNGIVDIHSKFLKKKVK
jgi:hypothetical protein